MSSKTRAKVIINVQGDAYFYGESSTSSLAKPKGRTELGAGTYELKINNLKKGFVWIPVYEELSHEEYFVINHAWPVIIDDEGESMCYVQTGENHKILDDFLEYVQENLNLDENTNYRYLEINDGIFDPKW